MQRSTLPGAAKGARRAPAAARPHRGGTSRRLAVTVRAGLLDTVVKPITTAGKIDDLKTGIAAFYDESSGLWERVWGEHMHHGYYPAGAPPKSNKQAQVDMIDEALSWAGVASARRVVDVGCGIGGSSRHIARKFGAAASGITLSPVQAARAAALTAADPALAAGGRVDFRVADALDMPFEDSAFDLVWSLESGEHMPDKRRFVRELCRVTAPGGRVLVVTWCHRVLNEGEAGLTKDELALLDRICEAYYLPAWCSIEDYRRLLEAEGMADVRTADWSAEVAPFWGAVIKSALTADGVFGLLRAGWTTIKGALVMPLMAQGFRTGLIKFNLIVATKPPQ